ncbi:MAG: NAD(P)H-quinone oxidoreductase [Dehalococcoidia bacterium]|jgi:putative PIG3 family NAD(P)H quinone oxidoreductase|nr:NAD(P)H-quinone oxidoreductase [Dehalococcoidia bacterium]|tara:strand:- start:278 stop:1261 length:984 start_codon:yes stop_codon:yes gene_type:complete
MRAAVITEPGGPDVLQIMEVDDPVPGPEDVLVDVKASALNRADMIQRQGNYPAPAGSPSDIPGLEFAGVVVEAGERVIGMAKGDRVFGLLGGGGYASRTITHHRMAIPMPSDWDFVQAAATPEVYFTAYDALFNRGNLQMGESLLVHAAGSGVGTAAVQLAHQAGAFVFGTAGSPKKLDGAAKLGMDVGINYHDEDFSAVVKEKTGGAGVDVLIDFIGGPYWDQNIASMAVLGRLVEVGLMGGGRVEVDLGQLLGKRLQVTGTGLRGRTLEEKLAITAQFKRHVLPHLASGSMKPIVDRTFPLEEVADAHRYMETNANFGKIVLTID